MPPGISPLPARLLAHPKPFIKLDKPRALEWDFTVFGRPYSRTQKKVFQNKLHSSNDQNTSGI